MTLDGFDGEELRICDEYRRELLQKTDRLRLEIGGTQELGDALTGDMLARNRRVIEGISPRNQSPYFDELFLTFLTAPEWIRPVDHELRQLRNDLAAARRAKSLYAHFIKQLERDPICRLFELSVYSILRTRFPTEPFPRLPNGKKEADIEVTVDGNQVAIELTVLGESAPDRQERWEMHALGRTVWSGSKDIEAEPRRLLRKIVEELAQTSTVAPNVLMVAIHMPATIESFYEQAIQDVFAGKSTSATQIVINRRLWRV